MRENKKNLPEAEISDELLDTVTGGAKPPEMKITPHTASGSKQPSAAVGTAEWVAQRAQRASVIPPTQY